MSGSRTTGPTLTSAAAAGAGVLLLVMMACKCPHWEPPPIDEQADKQHDLGSPIAMPASEGPGTHAALPSRHSMPAAAEVAPLPTVACPELVDADRALDAAGRAYDAGDFARAFACADTAADLIPQAVEAHHTRAAALAALGLHERAQVGFAMALALDPDDPQTLAAAADFYINLLPPKSRDHVLVGLEYARRGSVRAASRRNQDRALQARLFLLEAEAYNDIGRADLALPRVEEALVLESELVEARHERGVSLFNLCRFREAEAAFIAVLRTAPSDAYAHQHLALIYERMGRGTDAAKHFLRARKLAPTEFWSPIKITVEEFRAEVTRAIESQPEDIRRLLYQVSLEIVDLPALEDLTGVTPPLAPTILGLFRGLPLGTGDDAVGTSPSDDIPPRAIVLYQSNLARAVRTRDELNRQIRRTLIHEIGHLQGLDEDQLRRGGLE